MLRVLGKNGDITNNDLCCVLYDSITICSHLVLKSVVTESLKNEWY